MTSYEQIYQQVKLSLHRLNTIWSPDSSDTFCHNTSSLLRQAVWNDGNINASVIQLHLAHNSLMRAFAQWNSDGTIGDSVQRWSHIVGAAQNQLETLHALLNREQRAFVKTNFSNLF